MAIRVLQLWLIVVVLGNTTGDPSVFLGTPTDVTSGEELCSSRTPIIFECVGNEVTYLELQRNGVEIEPNINIGDFPGQEWKSGPYTLILVAIDVDQTRRVANMTTQLVVNISSLMSGDLITCATLGMNSSKMLNYTLRRPPPAPIIDTDFSISLGEENSTFYTFNISWNSSFTTASAITSYVISPPTSTTEGQDIDLAVSCPPSCSPDVPCQCSGLAVGGRVTVNISAINCDTQEGKPMTVTVASACPPNDLGTVVSETNSRCVKDGRFDGSVTIANGIGCFNTSVGSVAMYMCDEGYTLVHGADLMRTCLINGSWNGSIPECTEISHLSSFNWRIIVAVVIPVAVVILIAVVLIIMIILYRRRPSGEQEQFNMRIRFDPEPDKNYRPNLQR